MTAQTLALIVAGAGLVLYLLVAFKPATAPARAPIAEIGRLAFFAGLLAFLIVFKGF